MCCPVGFSEEFIAVLKKKMFQINTKNDKKQNFMHFSKNLCIFVEASTVFVGWDVLKGQQGKSWLYSSL